MSNENRPAVIPGQLYVLRRGEGPEVAGAILKIQGEYWKSKGKPKVDSRNVTYNLVPATKHEFDTRPARLRIGGSHVTRDYNYAGHQVGKAALSPSGNWVHIKKVEFVRSSGASMSSLTPYGVGNIVTPEKALELNQKWDEGQRIRRAELDAKAGHGW